MEKEELVILLLKKLLVEYCTGTMTIKEESLEKYKDQTLIVEDLYDAEDGPYYLLSIIDSEMYAKLSNELIRKLIIN